LQVTANKVLRKIFAIKNKINEKIGALRIEKFIQETHRCENSKGGNVHCAGNVARWECNELLRRCYVEPLEKGLSEDRSWEDNV
jgi:hypothetical protein